MLSIFKHQLLISAALAIALPALAQRTAAQEILISGPRTTSQELDGNKTLTITASGSIHQPADTNTMFNYAVSMSGPDNRISNSGNISTGSKEAATAILSTGSNDIIRNLAGGTVEALGDGSTGIGSITSASVENHGTITVRGDGSYGISVAAGSITNSGTITVTDPDGTNATAVYGYTGVTVTAESSSRIAVSGAESTGIKISADNIVDTREGSSITAAGSGASGLHIEGEGNRVTLRGSISTTGSNATAVLLDFEEGGVSNNNVTLTGTITTEGGGAAGIRVTGSNNTIRIGQSGMVRTRGANAHGLDIADGNTVIVDGNIHAEGAGAIGLKAGNNNVITLNGTIRSNQSNSVKFGNGNTINIGDNVKLFGTVDLGTNTIYVPDDGPSRSRLVDLNTTGGGGTGGGGTGGGGTGGGGTGGGGTGGGGTGGGGTGGGGTGGGGTGGGGTGGGGTGGGVTIIGGDDKPVFQDPVSGDIVEYDRTAVSSATNQLAEASSAITGLGMARLRGTLPATSAAVENFTMAEPVRPGADPAEAAAEGASSHAGGSFGLHGSGPWLAGFAGVYNYGGNSISLPTGVGLWGAAIGQDTILANGMRAGIFGGYSAATANAFDNGDLSVESQAEGYFAGAYGRAEIGLFYVDAAVSGGTNNHEASRYIADGQLGEVAADAEYSSWWISPEIAAGADIAAGNGWTYSPNARLRYAFESFEGYSEKGPSASNATVSQRQAEIAEGRIEIAFARQMDDVLFSAQLGWLQRWGMGEGDAEISVFGVSKTLAASSPDASAGYAGAGFDIAVAEGLLINLAGEATFGSDITGGRFDAGIRASF
jgi:hypothetical protein